MFREKGIRSSPYWLYTAIGAWDTAGGYFARVADALNTWGAEIYR